MPSTLEPASPDALQTLTRILDQARLNTHFQPIVSLRRKALIGVEALARAEDPVGVTVPPTRLFQWARQSGQVHRLDLACQQSALRAFSGLPQRDPELLLFMNIEASLLDEHPDLSLLQGVQLAGLDPQRVVIEINETQVLEQGLLSRFVQRHREQGFLIAMDDLGNGHSSLQRWPLLQPDIIKLDRSLVDGVAGNVFAQQLLRSIIALSRQTGAVVLAEGVETERDIQCCVDLGVDLYQGYYFAKPAAHPFKNLDQALDQALHFSATHKGRDLERIARRRSEMQEHRRIAKRLALSLSRAEKPAFGNVLRELPQTAALESLMVLDEHGAQVSPYVFVGEQPLRERPSLFQAPKCGSDHSDRDYYYGLMESGLDQDCFLSEPHLSNASGRPCRTLAHRFEHPDGQRYIACLEIGTV